MISALGGEGDPKHKESSHSNEGCMNYQRGERVPTNCKRYLSILPASLPLIQLYLRTINDRKKLPIRSLAIARNASHSLFRPICPNLGVPPSRTPLPLCQSGYLVGAYSDLKRAPSSLGL